VTTLDPGETLLLYTDGLETCDALLDRLVAPAHTDDVALAAVRLHSHDRPRPPEAGPNRVPDRA
jgi:hypothetical protein